MNGLHLNLGEGRVFNLNAQPEVMGEEELSSMKM
jgi:hypothetical protein